MTASADPASGPIPLAVTLTASADVPGSATWDLGDGIPLSGDEVSTVLLSAGAHTATATWTADDGRTATATTTVDVDPEKCPILGQPQLLGTVPDITLDEVSGIAASRKNPGVLWMHEDKNNPQHLYAVDAAGNELADLEILGVETDDTEDIAVGVDADGQDVIWLGDIGDNDWKLPLEARESVAIYGLPEPTIELGAPKEVAAIGVAIELTLTYPDYPRDAEALAADPVTGDLFVITKNYDGPTWFFRKAAPQIDGDEAVLEEVGYLEDAGPITAADISPLGDQLAIRAYDNDGLIWLRDGAESIGEAVGRSPCAVDVASLQQAEALAYAPDASGIYYTHERTPDIEWQSLSPGR